MDSERAAGRAQQRDQAGGEWDAAGSLKRNAKRPDDEVTPLLGNSGGSSEDGSNELQEHQWEGFADFEGVTWRHRPSVSSAPDVETHVPFTDTSTAVLATALLFPLCHCNWRHHSP